MGVKIAMIRFCSAPIPTRTVRHKVLLTLFTLAFTPPRPVFVSGT